MMVGMSQEGSISPVGIQRKRIKGFDLQIESLAVNGLPAKCVTRGTSWGNPYKIGAIYKNPFTNEALVITEENCLDLYRLYAKGKMSVDPDWLEPLRGYNLACFCSIGRPCHRDILLELL